MSESTVTSKGQITIPADIRKAMGLSTQDRVVFTPLQDGTVVMRAKTRSMADLKGLLKRPRGSTKVAIDDMNIGLD
ncbi:MAG: AbrB family transcriptional regulator [Leptothrix sp. (in: Bacteria)]|nr:AbrB family transcriptional regulator [Leptothrix sp. (in: b-proteobacteria)]